jgi:hypothetical protein
MYLCVCYVRLYAHQSAITVFLLFKETVLLVKLVDPTDIFPIKSM